MKMLNRKLLRDLRGSKGLLIAVTLIILLAVTFFGSMFMAAQNLGDSYDYSYDKLKFADFTVKTADDASEAVVQLRQIDGVNAVTARGNSDFTLNLPDRAESEKVLARVISLPADHSIWLDEQKLSVDTLTAALTTAVRDNPEKKLLIKGDQSLRVKDLHAVLEAADAAGAKGVSLAVEVEEGRQ